jgi:hypothetical protein
MSPTITRTIVSTPALATTATLATEFHVTTIGIDRIAIEAFARDGAAYLSGSVYPDPQADEIAVQ